MKRVLKKSLAMILALTMVFGVAPLAGLAGIELPILKEVFADKAEAATTGTCGVLSYEINNGEVTIIDCDTSASGELVIPESIEGYPVTSIGGYAFDDRTSLTSVTIPDSVTSIGGYAFGSCSNLITISVDENNTKYSSDEYGVLFNKEKTKLIQYPIGNSRTSYEIPNGVVIISSYAFLECSNLTSVTIPSSVMSIGFEAFCDCSNLTSITIPNSVTSIDILAFYKCTSLTIISVDENNMKYSSDEYGALFNKEKTELIQYPIGNTRTEYTISDRVTSIGICAIDYCKNLAIINADENNQNYTSDEYGVLFNKEKTKLIQYPMGNTRTEYTIPDSVTYIDISAFKSCVNLTSVTIPDSVTSIGDAAFRDCSSLTTVYYFGSPEEWNAIVIGSGNDKLLNATVIYVEDGEIQTETVTDEATNISVEYNSGLNEGEVGLVIERTFDGTAFQVIGTQLDVGRNEIYDIKMTIDGVETQPNGKVKVKIPVPAGYDPSKTFVYHVNTNTGTIENMNAVVEDGFLVFETDHFSYYAVVEIKDDEPAVQSYKITWNIDGQITEQEYNAGDVINIPANPTKAGYNFIGWMPAIPDVMPDSDLIFTAVFEKIEEPEKTVKISIKTPSTTTISYGDSIILHSELDGTLPNGARIEWTADNGNFDMSASADGSTCKVTPKSSGKTVFTVTAYDKDGNVISSDTQEMTAKAGIWQKIVAFFKSIFGLTKTFPEAYKNVF